MNYPLKFELDRRQAVLNIGYGAGSSPTFGTVLVADGTAAAPSISFAADTDTGFHRAGANVFTATAGGVGLMNFSRSGGGNGGRLSGTVVGNEFNLLDLGGVTITAAGTAQNITLTPSTSGGVHVANTGANTPRLYIQTTNTPTANGVLAFMGSAGTALLTFGTGQNIPGSQAFEWLVGSTTVAAILPSGRFLLGTTFDSGALLQVGTDLITKENGIVLGTDTFIYRRLSGAVAVAHATQPQIYLSDLSGSVHAYLLGSTNLLRIGGNAATAQTRIDSGGAQAVIFDTSQGATFAGTISGTNITASSGAYYAWTSKARIKSPSDGVVTLLNAAETDFTRLQFGGTTASFPALRRNATQLTAVLADDSAYAPIGALSLVLGATGVTTIGAGTGTPEAAVTAPVGSIWLRTNGGASTTLYVKESGAGNTGWVAK
jgi:hypothetical protein